ncbi:MAG: hypothetical protein D6741_10735, partial [Planctomycetota bacterium]
MSGRFLSVPCWGMWAVLAVATICGVRGTVHAETPDTLAQAFQEVPPEARRLTGPLFWLHGDESPERLREYLRIV